MKSIIIENVDLMSEQEQKELILALKELNVEYKMLKLRGKK